LTFGLWASKVSSISYDLSGFGSFTITTIQGKGNKYISFISAYIAVQKGTDIGVDSLFAQQVTLYERACLKKGMEPKSTNCPRKEVIKNLNNTIKDLQTRNHDIILMLDANQSLADCFSGSSIKPYSIEWLRLQRGLDDPFIQLVGRRPNSTTYNPNRDIDYVLTYGINATSISTLAPNSPTHSDHLGIVFDLDLGTYFSSIYSQISTPNHRILTSGNLQSNQNYITYFTQQIKTHKIVERTEVLYTKATASPPAFSPDDYLPNVSVPVNPLNAYLGHQNNER
jgi:hypothetical protein